jgi:ferredoxin--NADP+ reductase
VQSDAAALRREHYNAAVAGLRRIHEGLLVLRVQPDAPIPTYDAGQWIAIGVGLWEPGAAGTPDCDSDSADVSTLVRRPFSIGSPVLADGESRLIRPDEEDFYEFYVGLPRQLPNPPAITSRLFALTPGHRLWVDERPRGQNTLAGLQLDDDVLFAATGTGEAPHNRMIWELLRRGHRGRIASIVTTRHRRDQAYREVLERTSRLFPNFRYTAVATREPGEHGERLQDLLRSGQLEEMAGFKLDPRRARVFLCGNPAMIGAPRLQEGRLVYPPATGLVELLERERGFHADPRDGNINIHFERY